MPTDPLKPPRAEEVSDGPVGYYAAKAMRTAMLEWIVARWSDKEAPSHCYMGFPRCSDLRANETDYWCPVCVARKELGR